MPQRSTPAIRLIAYAIVFFAGAVLTGAGVISEGIRPNSGGFQAAMAGATIMAVDGIFFFIAQFDK